MAYTLDKELVSVKDAVDWIAEHAYPEQFQEDRRVPIKRVRQRIQDAFSLRMNLPGSESIEPTMTKALPNDGLLKAPQFFTWAVLEWPVLCEQEGIIPLLGKDLNFAVTLPPLTMKGFFSESPPGLDEEVRNRIAAAEYKAFLAQQENDALRAENDSLKKRLEEFEKDKADLSKLRSEIGKTGGRGKKKLPGQAQS